MADNPGFPAEMQTIDKEERLSKEPSHQDESTNQNGTLKTDIGDIINEGEKNADVKSSQLSIQGKSETDLLTITNTKRRFSPLTRQCITAFGSVIASLAAGLTSGYSAILLPQLELPDSPISIDTESSSWIASIAALPMAPGCILGGWMMDRYGRNKSHLILSVPFVIGWMLIAVAQGLPEMLVGRFLTGLCVGILGPVGSVYIGEISDPKYRGFLLAGVALAVAMGILLVHIIGTFVHWKMTATVCTFVPFLCFVIMSFVPETPNWLLSQNKVDKAIESFYWLRGYSEEATAELSALIEKHKTASVANLTETPPSKLSSFKRPEFYKPLIAMVVFFVTCQFSGVNAVAFYSVSIMKNTVGEGLNEYTAMLIIDIVRFVISVVACVLLRKYGRRPLAFISGITTTISLIGLSTFLYMTRLHPESASELTWLPVALLITYICAISIGLVPLPWVMTGEVFPVALRGPGSGICTAVAFAAFFVVVKTSPAMFKNLGDSGTFLTYGVFSLIGTAALWFILPETKGRTLQDIEEHFQGKTEKISKVV